MNWKEIENRLISEITFSDFISAWGFATQVAMIAEKQKHHPKITVNYNVLTLELTTHDEGNTVTEKDRQLATALEKMYTDTAR